MATKPITLEELLADLKIARQDEQDSKIAMTARLEELKSTDDVYKFQKGKNETATKLVAELTEQVKMMGITTYIASVVAGSPNKKPATGLEIAIFKVPVITNREAALGWAKKAYPAALQLASDKMTDIIALVLKHLPKAVVLDDGKIIKYARDNPKETIPGVTIKDDPRAQIASKL